MWTIRPSSRTDRSVSPRQARNKFLNKEGLRGHDIGVAPSSTMRTSSGGRVWARSDLGFVAGALILSKQIHRWRKETSLTEYRDSTEPRGIIRIPDFDGARSDTQHSRAEPELEESLFAPLRPGGLARALHPSSADRLAQTLEAQVSPP